MEINFISIPMSKSVKFVLAGAIALASVVACNKEVTSNPNYNPATGEVLTSFVFNVAATNTPITKQTPENTQAIPGTNGFLGIVDGNLLSFIKDAPVADGRWIPSAETANKQYSLGNIMSSSDATTNGDKSHKVIELALPTETNTLMFYPRPAMTTPRAKSLTQWTARTSAHTLSRSTAGSQLQTSLIIASTATSSVQLSTTSAQLS
jgi:hypothetical protein